MSRKGDVVVKLCPYCYVCLPCAKHICYGCGAPQQAYYKSQERKEAKQVTK